MANNRLYRSESDRILGGVCGGIAEVYDMDPTLVRLLVILIVLTTGIGPFLYLIAWLIMPTEKEVKGGVERNVEEVELDESGEQETEEETDEEESDEDSGEDEDEEEDEKE
jgi:phage shock protein PspC (stress-responsive transcriptional regulator)